MFYVKQSEATAARRRVPILMVDETDGSTPETGLTLYGLISKNGDTFAATAGTFAEAGYGQYYYQFATGEIDTLGWAGIHVTATGARNYDAIIHVTSYDAYSGGFITPGSIWSEDISGVTTAGTAGSQLNLVAAGGVGITAGDVWNYDISAISGAGLAGTQLNLAAAGGGGAGITAGDVWNYTLTSSSDTADNTLGNAYLQANQAESNTSSTNLRTSVWDFDIDSAGFNTSPPYAAGYLIAAGSGGGGGITAADVWNYVIGSGDSADLTLTTAKTAAVDAQTNTAPAQIRSNVWDFDIDNSGFATFPPYASGYLINAGNGATTAGSQVWSYVTREITGGTATTVTNPVLVDPASMTGIANTVWNTDVSAFLTPSAGYDLTQAAAATGITAGDVWDYGTRTITGGAIDTNNDKTGYSLSASQTFDLTGNITGNLSGSVGSVTNDVNVSTASMSGIANTVWSAATRTITGGIADTVTSVTNPVSITTASMSGVAGTVWNSLTASYTANDTFGKTVLRSDVGNKSGDVTLRSAGGINMVDADVHRVDNDADAATFLKNALTGIGASWTGNVVGNVTGTVNDVVQPVDVSTGSMSGIANTVWSTDISAYTAPSAGYDLANVSVGSGITAGDVWSYATRDITGGTVDTITNPVDISTQSVTDIWSEDVSAYSTPSAGFDLTQAASGSGLTAGDVWDYATRTITGGAIDTNNDKSGYSLSASQAFDLTGNITGNLSGSVGSVTNAVDITTNSMSGTAGSVWDYATRTLTSGSGLTAGDVWSYATRTTTGGVVDTNNDKTGYSLSASQAFDVTGNITGNVSGSVGSVTNPVDITTNAMSGTAGSVWNYVTRTLTSGGGVTAGDVWSYGTRTITGGTIDTNNDKTGYALSTAGVNAVQSGLSTLTQAQVGTEVDSSLADVGLTTTVTGRIDAAISTRLAASSYTAPPTEAAIAGTVWNYVTRTLTSGGSGITAGDVWSYGTRTITGGTVADVTNPVEVSTTSMSGIAGTVWATPSKTVTGGTIDTVNNAVTVATASMTGIAGTVWSTNVSAYTSPSAGYYVQQTGTGATPGDVWSYGTRTITGGIANTVTTVTDGVTVTTNNDKSGYALSTAGVNAVQSGLSTLTQAQVGTEVDASLSDVGLTTTVTGRIDAAVSSRLASSSYTAPPTTAAIATTVWSAATRTLTSGAGATAGDVWSYNISGITASGSAGAQLNDASVSGSVVTVVNGPYKLTSIAEGVDGRIDILADSVQTIQLNCLDGFSAPFNITGYTAVVNVYDVSGALAATYTPTVNFAQNGILSFDIDTDITGVTGRYTLVVELTAGAEVIQLGPIEILVRPL